MAPFTGGAKTKDANRSVHAASYAGDNQGAEGAYPVTLTADSRGRQALPDPVQQGSVRLQSGIEDGCYPMTPTGSPALGVEDTDEMESRDATPNPNPTGTIPTATSAGDHGAGFFGATAPLEVPQFPKDSFTTGLTPDEVVHT